MMDLSPNTQRNQMPGKFAAAIAAIATLDTPRLATIIGKTKCGVTGPKGTGRNQRKQRTRARWA